MSKLSKRLSYVLRHSPDSIGLKLDKSGWALINDLLEKLSITIDMLNETVKDDEKGRFEISSDLLMIRACQGHSVDVDLGLEKTVPPDLLYHGTIDINSELIFKEGLKKMRRHHVHLSVDAKTARIVGSRRGDSVILTVHALEMHNDGFDFYKSNNNVWLTDHVPPKYIHKDSFYKATVTVDASDLRKAISFLETFKYDSEAIELRERLLGKLK